MNITFRALKANEVEVRPAGEPKNNKINLLLYQDARCAKNILDETVGNINWQVRYYSLPSFFRTYSKGSDGVRNTDIQKIDQIYCEVGIRDTTTNEWVWKSDTGSESNIEAEKGLASDAFKRASVAWGIGRELYTGQRITIELEDKDYFNGKFCQSFSVSEMEVSNGVITKLVVVDKFKKVRYTTQKDTSPNSQKDTVQKSSATIPATPEGPHIKEKFTAFCDILRADPKTDKAKLNRFQEFYLGPDKNNPNLSIVEAWKNPVFDKMWANCR